ncbi:MAG TPA: transglutaminase domain-containing protein [bacterium]|nr:transglutaminase domain-containing protein [bacterium]
MKLFHYRSTPLFIVLWLICVGLLQREVTSQSFLAKDALIDINDGALIMRQDYLGFYLANKKVGFSRFVLKEDNSDSISSQPGKHFLFQSDMFIQIEALGMPVTIKMRQLGEVNEDLTLRAFNFSYEASGQTLSRLITAEKDGLHVTTKSDNNTSNEVIPTNSPVYNMEMIHLLLAREGLETGRQNVFPVFDPMLMSLATVNTKVEDRETLTLPGGEKVDTFKAAINLKGLRSTSWIDTNGNVYKEVSPVAGITFTSIRESKDDATNMDFVSEEIKSQPAVDAGRDLIKASRILIDPPITNPEDLKVMKFKLSGAAKDEIPSDGEFQKLIKEEDGNLILQTQALDYAAVRESAKDEKPPYSNSDAALEPYLKADSLVQSDNARIREKAMEITSQAATRWEASRAIAQWLYTRIKKEIRVTIPSALEILSSMKGDCNEHSTLFAALARSLGIPTKIIAGLVFQDDGFYYHAWNEVYVGGRWVPLDSTLNRIEMDAAHIKLAEGSLEAQTDIVGLIGNLKVEILDLEYKD